LLLLLLPPPHPKVIVTFVSPRLNSKRLEAEDEAFPKKISNRSTLFLAEISLV
jgi:hypothetical protein